MQALVTIFDLAWLCAVLVLLFAIWRGGATRLYRLQQTLIEAAMKSAEAAKRAADAAYLLAEERQPRA